MSILKRKNLLVGVTTCALFLSTGCLNNLANSNFSPKNNFNAKQINTESDGIVALKEVFDRISQKGIELAVTDRFKARLIDEGYNPAYGARPLRRTVMRLLEDSLSEEVLSERLQSGDAAVVDVDENGKVQVLTADKFETL